MLVQNQLFVCRPFLSFSPRRVPRFVLLLALLMAGMMQWKPVLAAAPEIDVYYGSSPIVDGSSTVQSNDCTDFGAANVDGTGLSCQYQIYNSGDAILRNVVVTIIGAQKDDFHLDYAPDTLIVPGSSSTFQITFYPKAVGIRNATVRITSNDSDESPYTFAIRGQVAPAELDVSCSSTGMAITDGSTTPSTADCTDFGIANVDGYSAVQQFNLNNPGNDYLRDLVVTITGADAEHFYLYSYPLDPIAPTSSSYIQLYFTPKSVGVHQATVTIASNDSDENPYTFAIQGTATPGEIDLACSNGVAIADGSTTPSTNDCTDFGAANVDNSYTTYAQFDIYNTGNNYLRDVVVTITGAGAEHFYLYNPSGDTVGPESSGYFGIYFIPKTAGIHQATVSIASSDSDENPYTFVIQGTATPAEIDVSCSNGAAIANGSTTPSTNDCTDLGTANVDNNYTTYAQFDTHNSGNDYLRNVVVTITGAGAEHFYLYNPSGDTVGPESSGYFYIYFTPKVAGIHQATVSIASSDSDENPYTFVIQGEATPAEINMRCDNTGVAIPDGSTTPSSNDCTDFGNANVDSSTSGYQFGIYNTGNDYLRNITVTITGADAEHFSLYDPNGADYVIAPGASSVFYLAFTPKAVGMRHAMVRVANSDSDENPYTFTVQGNGRGPLTLSITTEPTVLATRNFRFTTDAPGTLPSPIYLDSDSYGGLWPPYGDTDGDGIWNMTTSNGIPAGNYHVTARLPFLWNVYGIDCDKPALVAIQQPTVSFNLDDSTGLGCTYHFKRSALIRVLSFHDQNGNGRRNATEPYLPGWRFTLRNSSDAVLHTLTTNDLGKASFADLLPDTYTVCIEVSDGWYNTAPGGAPACYTHEVGWGNALTLRFGNRESALTSATLANSTDTTLVDAMLTTPADNELSEGDQTWLTTAEPTMATELQYIYLPTVLR